jgi:hypothetical protein
MKIAGYLFVILDKYRKSGILRLYRHLNIFYVGKRRPIMVMFAEAMKYPLVFIIASLKKLCLFHAVRLEISLQELSEEKILQVKQICRETLLSNPESTGPPADYLFDILVTVYRAGNDFNKLTNSIQHYNTEEADFAESFLVIQKYKEKD